MINKNFYPTPKSLIEKMLNNVNLSQINTILEPSAGKGDIVEYINNITQNDYYSYYKTTKDIDCIEQDKDLQATLKGKNFRVVYDDFLTFNTFKYYDLIIMNPPFDNGDKHLLKALELQKNGGSIICLLNAETILNPYSNTRKELMKRLKDYNADIEYLENAFLDAERETNVEVALIKINIPQKESICDLLENLKTKNYKEYNETSSNEVAQFCMENNFLDAITEQYNREVDLALQLLNIYNSTSQYLKNSFDDKYLNNLLVLQLHNKESLTQNNIIKEIRKKYWTKLFTNENFTKNLTSNLISELYKKIEDLKNYDFSIYNIMTIKQELIKNTITGIEDTILKLFDEFTANYSWYPETKNNIHYYNGWATNKAWKINKKIILPLNAYSDYWGLDLRYNITQKFNDIIQVMNYLSPRTKKYVDVKKILEEAQNTKTSKDIDFIYFTVTFYKKGTTHITFKDLDLLERFNLYGSQKRNWLPPEFLKRKYKDMNKEEQKVVDEYCGKDLYEKMFKEPQNYLINTQQLLLA